MGFLWRIVAGGIRHLWFPGDLDWRAPCISAARRAYEAHRYSVDRVRGCRAGGWRVQLHEREKVLDIGPLEATTETRKTIPLAPVAGLAAIAGGIALVAIGSKKRV